MHPSKYRACTIYELVVLKWVHVNTWVLLIAGSTAIHVLDTALAYYLHGYILAIISPVAEAILLGS